ncbi:hypothetical protein F442_06816 [Phytophthora nicotianae P10297]|uniref:Uncharacterized protein n=4 Tax=Phytophthora nicotianae TaxID=4792 RepID=W2REZ0_PHYN3|nr:hypothetical protein PPTG_02872 [Phytophthora nicotianae INRA-310]ETI49328.1 hypothetical protein F443_06778 [Phytophthora nicotianae P1569]ETL42628.1 hypothetical protein L916_06590 [Phytophthora nicotianae]ETP47042.1 hypothetical protein F442_06816 [Phytophthora nicotianae P10297]ETL95799.1 hypothetical protein L917_06461 [Phytophthora nicotianae]ETM48986.1 hypothetical protein L914_06564 [Phytophthora nicotianae]
MQRVWPSLVLFALYVIVASVAATNSGVITDAIQTSILNMDPGDVVNGQFDAVPPITSTSSASEAVDWLTTTDEIFSRVATGGLTSLPPNGLSAIETMETEIASSPSLLNNADVLKKLLHVLPSLWDIGFWYRPVSEWKTEFGNIYDKAVSAAKIAHDATCYDAAVNATSLMIRFTKDQVFWDGEDHGDSVELQGQNKDYLAYLPELVTILSKKEDFTLTEAQLRTFMATKMPSKTEGMNTAVAFPVYVDTSIYKASDASALAELVC